MCTKAAWWRVCWGDKYRYKYRIRVQTMGLSPNKVLVVVYIACTVCGLVCVFSTALLGGLWVYLFIVCSLFMFTHFFTRTSWRILVFVERSLCREGVLLLLVLLYVPVGGLRGGISGCLLCVGLIGGCDAAFAWCSVLFA